MKNKKFLFISLLILAIGFAAVSTTLYISGNLVFGTNKNDFEVYFSGAIIDNEDKSNEAILSDKKHIEYETKELKTLGDTSVLEFEVTNNSTQYDANVSISCTLSDSEYVSYTTDSEEYKIPAQTRKSGKVTVELIKASISTLNPTISCELVSTAEERTSGADVVIKDVTYQMTGEGEPNTTYVVYSETPHIVVTDDYGFFYVNGLEKGSHEIYYLGNVSEDLTSKTKTEIKELALDSAYVNTSNNEINFKNIKLNNFAIEQYAEDKVELIFNANGSTVDTEKLEIKRYTKVSNLQVPTDKPYYTFIGWFDGEKEITENTIIRDDMNLEAKWEKIVWLYSYLGTYQTFVAPKDATYKLEVWGAYSVYGAYGGGYTVGEIDLVRGQTIYIAVGGAGGQGEPSGGSGAAGVGGWNGGGNGSNGSGTYPGIGGKYLGGGGGGGATSIQSSLIGDGQVKNYSSNKDKVIIVAGGAGATGGCGYTPGEAGNGSGGGSFGVAGNPPICSTEGAGGGGGGYYGGRAGLSNIWSTSSNSYGGTGYIGQVKNGRIVKGDLEMPSPTDLNSTVVGNFNSGFARISIL